MWAGMTWSFWLANASAMQDLEHHTPWPWVLRIECKARCLIRHNAKPEEEFKMWEISGGTEVELGLYDSA